jgi:hypothetical protein
VMTMTPSWVTRCPASRMSRALNRRGQRGRAARIETQLHRARHFVDVLPARPRGTNKCRSNLLLVERQIFVDRDHIKALVL